MPEANYELSDFIQAMRTVTAETDEYAKIIGRLKPLAQKLVRNPALKKEEYRVCGEEQGFGVNLLHEEEDHTLAVFVISWLPGRGTPAHDHGTWALVTGIEGDECNIWWRRNDDGSNPEFADITKVGELIAKPGDSVALQPREIHTVYNPGVEISLSLHVYGRHINHTDRYQFDPETKRAERLVLKVNE